MSSVSTDAAIAFEDAIIEIASIHTIPIDLPMFRPPMKQLKSIHVDRNHVHDPSNQQHKKQWDVQHMPERK